MYFTFLAWPAILPLIDGSQRLHQCSVLPHLTSYNVLKVLNTVTKSDIGHPYPHKVKQTHFFCKKISQRKNYLDDISFLDSEVVVDAVVGLREAGVVDRLKTARLLGHHHCQGTGGSSLDISSFVE